MFEKIFFNGIWLKAELQPQSPMIHFQGDQFGATLRASEVKPKFDRFILKKLMKTEGRTLEELKKDTRYSSMFLNPDQHDSLKYKMSIEASSETENYFKLNRHNYPIYYGNQGEDNKDKYGVLRDATLTVSCFHEGLRELISENIMPFFLVTNFGTMQGKGFGSFLPVPVENKPKDRSSKSARSAKKEKKQKVRLSEEEERQVARCLIEETGAEKCYCMRFESPEGKSSDTKANQNEKIFKEIRAFYSIMKSGQNYPKYARSYIYSYMHDEYQNRAGERKNIANEKAWMKKLGIAPSVFDDDKDENRKTDADLGAIDDTRYVRAMLGIGESVKYKKDLKQKPDYEIKISHVSGSKEEKLERVSSPILFKVIRGTVFIVARRIPEEILDQLFFFSGPDKSCLIRTLDYFDIDHFLQSYVKYYNSTEEYILTDKTGKEITDKNGKPIKRKGLRECVDNLKWEDEDYQCVREIFTEETAETGEESERREAAHV